MIIQLRSLYKLNSFHRDRCCKRCSSLMIKLERCLRNCIVIIFKISYVNKNTLQMQTIDKIKGE